MQEFIPEVLLGIRNCRRILLDFCTWNKANEFIIKYASTQQRVMERQQQQPIPSPVLLAMCDNNNNNNTKRSSLDPKKGTTAPCKKKAQAKKKIDTKKTKTTVAKVEKGKQRQPNFQAIEDILLCKAYVNCTENPLIGNDQTAETFWNSVLQTYNNLQEKEKWDEDAIIVERDYASLRNRFQRTIAKQLKEWNPFYKRVAEAPPSGTTKAEWIQLASENYSDQYERTFNFEHCVEILHKIPKFDPMIGDKSDDEEHILEEDGSPAAVNRTTVAMASKLERPIGNKKAKQIQKMEKDDKSMIAMLSKQQAGMNKIAVSNENIAQALEEKNRIKSRQMKINNLWKRLDFYEKKGNDHKVGDIMEQIEALENQEETSMSTEEVAKKVPTSINVDRYDTESPSKTTGSGSPVGDASAAADSATFINGK